MHGCNADGIHVQCRFCGKDVYADIPCPASEVCSFANEPSIPYYWDPECTMGKLGCMADGMHAECRFCGKRPFDGIPCPAAIEPPQKQCAFPLHGEPTIGYYWDEACESGELGCWADGMHAECRFCGSGVYQEIPCPNSTVAVRGKAAEAEEQYDAALASQAFMRVTSLQGLARDISVNTSDEAENGTERARGDVLLSGAAMIAPSLAALASLLGLVATSLVASM